MKRRLAAAGVLATLLLAGSTLPVGAAASAPNDPLASKQWGLAFLGAPQAWTTATGKGVTIGVIDSGADLGHEDLAGKIIANVDCVGAGTNPTGCQGSGQDDQGRGTREAGIAAADTNNGKGVAGTAPDAKLVVAKAVDSGGHVSIADVVAAIQWAVGHGARVVNLSLGDANLVVTNVTGASLQNAIEDAWSKGAITVLASGNAAALGFPSGGYANLDAVVVGAVGRDGTVAGYSAPTGSAKWAVVAPGGSNDGSAADDILSTSWIAGQQNVYAPGSGTSMAAPFVSGTLALLLSAGLTPAQAVAKLLASVNTAVNCGPGSTNCHGMVDAATALAGITAGHGPTTTASPTTTTPKTTAVPPSSTIPADRPSPTLTAPPVMNAGPHAPSASKPGSGAKPGDRGTAATAGNVPPADASPVALANQAGSHSGRGSFLWFAVLAGLFAIAGGAGVLWLIHTNAEAEPL